MSNTEKLLARFRLHPPDFTFNELRRLLRNFGYTEDQQGKTSGSRVGFRHSVTGHLIRLHKPHPANVLKEYQLKLIETSLHEKGLL